MLARAGEAEGAALPAALPLPEGVLPALSVGGCEAEGAAEGEAHAETVALAAPVAEALCESAAAPVRLALGDIVGEALLVGHSEEVIVCETDAVAQGEDSAVTDEDREPAAVAVAAAEPVVAATVGV